MATGREVPAKTAYVFVCSVLLLCSFATSSCPSGMSAENFTAGGNMSLESVLRVIDARNSSDMCFVVHLAPLPVRHVLSEIMTIWGNVVLRSEPGGIGEERPVVSCDMPTPEVPLPSQDTQNLAALTLRGPTYVGIEDLQFENCPLSVQFLEVEEVSISNSLFRNFTVGGAVNIYNCSQVTVESCTFTNNTAQGILADLPYRGNGGGLSIGIHNVLGNQTHNYVICDCTFTNNSAWSNGTRARSSTDIIEDRIFNGRGGGVALVLSEGTPVTVLVQNCTFSNNTALSFAGGLYFLPAEPSRGHTYTVVDSFFEGNVAFTGGGGLGVGYISNGAPDATNWFFIRNSTVRNNWSNFGGGMYIIPGSTGGLYNRVFMEDCEFTNNEASGYGAAVALSSLRSFLDREQVGEVFFRDNMFYRNVGSSGGILSSYYYSLRFEGANTFMKNTGSSMRVVSSLVHVNGTLVFSGNYNEMGSALYVSSFGQLLLYNGSQLLFEGNEGSIASAIEVEPLFVEPFLIQTLFNPQCFFLYEDTTLPPYQWKVNISFVDNKASIGSAIYTSQLGLCSFASLTSPIFRLDRTFLDGPFYYRNNTNEALSKEESYDIATTASNFSVYTRQTFAAFPGEELVVVVRAWDELGNPTAGLYRITERQSDDEYSLRFLPSSVLVLPNAPNLTVHFGSTSDEFDGDEHTVEFQLDTPNRFSQLPEQSFVAVPSPCPAGHVLSESPEGLFLCLCNTDNEDILDCDRSGLDVVLRDGTWGVTYLVPSELRHKLEVSTCPSGYCQCRGSFEEGTEVCRNIYREEYPGQNFQCTCNRRGPLCGECINGTSVSALLDNCRSCSDANATLIVALILLDVTVLVAIMLLSLWKSVHLPAWTYPFIFYIQLAPYATRTFPLTFDIFHSYMFYLGSLLGLYFPYDFCLYPNATAVEVYAIKYIPFILASIICPSVIVAANCRGIKVNYSGVWLILMLLFNQVVYTSASVLNCPMMRDETGSLSSVWFVDGTVKCFTGGHIPLALWAIFCLLLCVVAIFTPLVFICWHRESQPRVLRSAAKAVVHVYRDRYRWWYLVELMRRFLVIIVVVATPSTPTARSFVLMLAFGLFVYCKPYKQTLVNYLEIFLLGHFVTMLLIKATGIVGIDEITNDYQFLPETDECGNPILSPSSLAIILAVWYYFPLLLVFVVPAAYLIGHLRHRAKWRRTEKEKELKAQQVELRNIQQSEEHITSTSLNLEDDDFGGRASSVSQPKQRGHLKTFSQFIRSIKRRRATQRPGTADKPPLPKQNDTLPEGLTASSKV